jgi:hypothetical protein
VTTTGNSKLKKQQFRALKVKSALKTSPEPAEATAFQNQLEGLRQIIMH